MGVTKGDAESLTQAAGTNNRNGKDRSGRFDSGHSWENPPAFEKGGQFRVQTSVCVAKPQPKRLNSELPAQTAPIPFRAFRRFSKGGAL